MKRLALFSLSLIAAATLSAQQAAPKLMHYQGKLTNSSGAALGDGQYTLRFELFDAATAGQRIWGESRANVPLSGGLFSVVLGAAGSTTVTPSAVNDLGFAFGGADRYLQTTVVSGPGITTERTLLPRQQLASVPFALQSQNAQNAVSADQAANSALLNGQPGATFMPPGGVIAFSGSSAPDGWLLCNGQAVSRTTYQALFNSLGGASSPYGLPDASTFNVPDYRGMFLRGVADIPSATISAVDTALETVTVTSHPYRRNGIPVRLTGTLPTGLVANTTYYTVVVDANKLAFAATEANAVQATPSKVDITGTSTGGAVVQAVDPDAAKRRNPVGNSGASGIGSFQGDEFRTHSHPMNRSDSVTVGGLQFAVGAGFASDRATGSAGGNETRPQNVYVNYIIKF